MFKEKIFLSYAISILGNFGERVSGMDSNVVWDVLGDCGANCLVWWDTQLHDIKTKLVGRKRL